MVLAPCRAGLLSRRRFGVANVVQFEGHFPCPGGAGGDFKVQQIAEVNLGDDHLVQVGVGGGDQGGEGHGVAPCRYVCIPKTRVARVRGAVNTFCVIRQNIWTSGWNVYRLSRMTCQV